MIERDAMAWMSLAHDERADFAAFLATLSPADWDRPTLCGSWRVRDVFGRRDAVHELSGSGQATLAARLER